MTRYLFVRARNESVQIVRNGPVVNLQLSNGMQTRMYSFVREDAEEMVSLWCLEIALRGFREVTDYADDESN